MNDDLNAEKLSEIQARLEELESEISQSSESQDTSTVDFFDQVDGERQTIVHWLEDVDASTVVSIGTAKEKFIEFSESRAEETTDHQVSHGDVLVIGGDCPWYAVCAKVDRGVGGGDAGFQAEDPMDVAGTELENEKAYKEFIVWGGCDKIESLEEVIEEIRCPSGSGTTVAVGSASSLPGATSQVAKPLEMVSIGSSVNTELNKLKALSISRDSQSSSPTEEFFAFSSLAAHVPQSSSSCDPDCGLWMTVKKFSSKTEEYKIESTVSAVTINTTPVNLSERVLSNSQSTLTVTSATLSSDKCGNLAIGAGTNSTSTVDSISSNVSDQQLALHTVSIFSGEDLSISLGTLELMTGVQSSSVSLSSTNIFLPTLPVEACPKTGDYTLSGSKVDIKVSLGGCESVASLGGSLNQKVRIYTQPYGRDVGFECGIATKVDDETLGGTTQTHAEFWQPCVVSLGCEASGSETTHTISDSTVSISTSSVSLGTLLTWTPLKRESVITFDSCGNFVSLSSGNWAGSSEFAASSVTIPDSSSSSTEDCSEGATDTSTSTETEYRINMTSNSAGQVTHQRQKRTITTTYNSCGHFMSQATPTDWTNDTGTGSVVTFNTLPSDYETQTVVICENNSAGSSTTKTLTVMGTKT